MSNTTPKKPISLKKILLILTILSTIAVVIMNWHAMISLFIPPKKLIVKIKGFVYKNAKNVPFKGCTVVIKELQSIVPPKVVDDNGMYISDPINKERIKSIYSEFDFKIQVKYRDSILTEQTKRIEFEIGEAEPSFGDIIILYNEPVPVDNNKKAGKDSKAKDSHNKSVEVGRDNNAPIIQRN